MGTVILITVGILFVGAFVVSESGRPEREAREAREAEQRKATAHRKREHPRQHEETLKRLEAEGRFHPCTRDTVDGGYALLTLDLERRELLHLTSMDPPKEKFISLSTLTDALYEENNRVVTVTTVQTDRGSQVKGALVGGVLAGGAGVVVGGLSGKKTADSASNSEITSVTIRLLFNNKDHPELLFAYSKYASGGAKAMVSRLKSIVASYDANSLQKPQEEAKSSEQTTTPTAEDASQSSFVGELQKLVNLHKEGHLTSEEFAAMKQKLTR